MQKFILANIGIANEINSFITNIFFAEKSSKFFNG